MPRKPIGITMRSSRTNGASSPFVATVVRSRHIMSSPSQRPCRDWHKDRSAARRRGLSLGRRTRGQSFSHAGGSQPAEVHSDHTGSVQCGTGIQETARVKRIPHLGRDVQETQMCMRSKSYTPRINPGCPMSLTFLYPPSLPMHILQWRSQPYPI